MRKILHTLYERYPDHQFTITAEDIEAKGTVTYPNGTTAKFFIRDGKEWPPYERIPEGSEFWVKVYKLRLIEILDHGIIDLGDNPPHWTVGSSTSNTVVPKAGPFPYEGTLSPQQWRTHGRVYTTGPYEFESHTSWTPSGLICA